MITIEILEATSTKAQATATMQKFEEVGRLADFMKHRRHPNSCLSRVLSVAEADTLWPKRHDTVEGTNHDSLLGACGMCCYSAGDLVEPTHVFLTDDSQFGWKILKEMGWSACSFHHCGTSNKDFQSWREHLAHYFPTAAVIESNEQLLKLLSEGDSAWTR
jgi:hypothetical protein